jgi:nicotinamide mononucleotide transporter
MNIPEWANLFWQQIKETDAIQWIAVLLGVAEVLLAKANKIWLYPTGIAGILLSAFILFESGLYAECLLNGYYLVMSAYGWWYWIKKRNQPPIKITNSTRKDWWIVIGIVIIGFFILYYSLRTFTPSMVPVWDAWVSATAWAGMWLLAKRKVENWILLNISNIFAIPLLVYKQLPLFAALTLFLFIVAIFGFFEWKKILRQENSPAKS